MFQKTKVSIRVCEFIEKWIAYLGLYTFICTVLPIGEHLVYDMLLVSIGYLLCAACVPLLRNVPAIVCGYLMIFAAMCGYGYYSKIPQAGALFTNMAMAITFLILQCRACQVGFEKEPYEGKWYHYVEPIGLYIYGMITDLTFTRRYAVFCGIVFLSIQFWCKYLENIYQHLDIHPEMGEEKQQEFFEENTRIIFYLLIAFSLALIFVSFFEYDFILIWIGKKILYLIGLILYGLAWCFDKIMHLLGLLGNGKGLSNNVSNYYADMLNENNALMQFLFRLFGMVFFTFLIYRLLKSAKHYLLDKRELEKPHVRKYDPENYEKDQFISLRKDKKDKRRQKPDTNQEKVRFLYRKYVLSKRKGERIPKGQTARELTNDTFSKDEDLLHRMQKATSLYEKARYANEEITSQDVDEMKSYK